MPLSAKILWRACWLLTVLGMAFWAEAALIKQECGYTLGKRRFRSQVIFDDSGGRRPGVLVFPEWWGINDYAKRCATRLAQMGYTAMAVDIYGDGRHTTNPRAAAQWSDELKKTGLLREHCLAAYQAFIRHGGVDPQRVAAVGYCFGGTAVLALAYAGADLKGAVTFHAGLTVPTPAEARDAKPALLILHGAADPLTPAATIRQFRAVLEKTGKDWQMVYYGGAVHAFTNPDAGSNIQSGVAYHPRAAARSWRHMCLFLEELFPEY